MQVEQKPEQEPISHFLPNGWTEMAEVRLEWDNKITSQWSWRDMAREEKSGEPVSFVSSGPSSLPCATLKSRWLLDSNEAEIWQHR